jgi:glucosamine-6-phosphate deaminase
MNWITVDDYEQLSRAAAKQMLDAVRAQPRSVLGLPTGRTPIGMYGELVRECSADASCFRETVTFNLDEYAGVPPSHPGSYCSYMRRNFVGQVDIDPRNFHIPDGTAERVRRDDPALSEDEALAAECARYEESIAAAGGLDMTYLGLGRNGHIGFNEPGASFASRTHVILLSESTRKANADDFADGVVPDRAITMGIATILGSRSIVLLASGASKREAVARLRGGNVSEEFPASALHAHHDVTIIVDRAAGGGN